jgi:transposase
VQGLPPSQRSSSARASAVGAAVGELRAPRHDAREDGGQTSKRGCGRLSRSRGHSEPGDVERNDVPAARCSLGVRGNPPALHFTPTYSCWLNLVERWFAELTTKWLKRSAHHSLRDLVASTRTWITNRNQDRHPCVWDKTADQILTSLASYCRRISDSGD